MASSSSSQPPSQAAFSTKRLRRPKSPTLENLYVNNCFGSEGLSSDDDDDMAMWGWKNYLSTGKRKKFIVSPSCSIEDEENEKSVAFSSSGGGEEKEVEGDFGENTKNGVGAWLGRLELERYASLFHAHEVDEAVLPFLTIDDLKDMGISAVGTRRKMLRSIEKLPR